jgi:6-phosphogluconolactonase
VWIGTYTGPQSQGIYAFRFDDETGTLSPLGLAAETPSPSFLALHPNGKVLYAVNETHDGPGNSGMVTAFAIDPASGRLTKINEQPSRGADPCHLAVDATGQYLVVANYTGGNFVVFPLAEDGRLAAASSILANRGSGPNHERQDGPHAHDVVFDARTAF